jgi:threonine dehydrogenase-like Zn-dependent dehydrogenase
MRGVLRTGPRAVRLADVPQPQLEPGTAIVRVRASGICGSDLHVYRAEGAAETSPAGHEVAGEVVAVAPHPESGGAAGTMAGPHRVREGDRVAIDTICLGRACGECRWCAEGAYFHCQRKRQGSDWSGAFAEYIKRDVRGMFPLPTGVSLEEGAMVEPLAVGVHALRRADLRPGESVAVVGAGTIGLAVLLGARGMDAGPVYVLARYPHQAELARALGATDAFHGPPEESIAAVRDATGGGADVVVETVGGKAPTLDQSFALVRRRGRVAVLGLFDGAIPVHIGPALHREVDVRFANCYGDIDGKHDYDVAIDMIAAGKAPIARLLTHRFSLDAAPEAFRTADDKRSGAVKVQLSLP